MKSWLETGENRGSQTAESMETALNTPIASSAEALVNKLVERAGSQRQHVQLLCPSEPGRETRDNEIPHVKVLMKSIPFFFFFCSSCLA